MVRTYFRAVVGDAWSKSVHDVVGDNWSTRLTRAALAAAGLALPWAYVTWFNQTGSDFNDAWRGTLIAAGAVLTVFSVGFAFNVIFVSPYRLWLRQRGQIADLSKTVDDRKGRRAELLSRYAKGKGVYEALRATRSDAEAITAVANLNAWTSNTADWITRNMGEGALARFQKSGKEEFAYLGAEAHSAEVARARQKILTVCNINLNNLEELVKTHVWDGD